MFQYTACFFIQCTAFHKDSDKRKTSFTSPLHDLQTGATSDVALVCNTSSGKAALAFLWRLSPESTLHWWERKERTPCMESCVRWKILKSWKLTKWLNWRDTICVDVAVPHWLEEPIHWNVFLRCIVYVYFFALKKTVLSPLTYPTGCHSTSCRNRGKYHWKFQEHRLFFLLSNFYSYTINEYRKFQQPDETKNQQTTWLLNSNPLFNNFTGFWKQALYTVAPCICHSLFSHP